MNVKMKNLLASILTVIDNNSRTVISEPYGLVLDQACLQSHGARRVIYGTETEFHELDPADRAFFQPTGKAREWPSEREWRLIGDLHLRELPPEAVRVFTRTRQEAWTLARRYNWPVLWTTG